MTPDQQETEARIVVGLDGSKSSIAALEWAAGQATLTGSTLDVLTTWEWPTSYGWSFPFPEDFDPAEETRKSVGGILDSAKVAHPDVDLHSVILEGHAAPSLVEAARGARLLVVGSRGHSEFSGMLLGSVSEFCAHHASCPVVIIH
jgi:nucleotide-binding universal stress UspA family protein